VREEYALAVAVMVQAELTQSERPDGVEQGAPHEMVEVVG